MPADLITRIRAIQRNTGVAETGEIDMATCLELEKRGNISVNSTNLTTHIKNVQRMVRADDDGLIGPETITKIEAFINPALPKIPTGGSLVVSTTSLEMIIAFEVTSKELYERKYQQPTWPGGESGVTIGIGYDLGYYTKTDIDTAWGGFVSADTLAQLQSVRGLKGTAAKNATPGVSGVRIPYAVASKVFYMFTLPAFARQVKKIYAGTEKLPPDAQGALLSLVYNRGADVDPNKSRRKEMFNIIQLVANGDLGGIATQIRNMKRLWPDVKGLRDRRDKEAAMVQNASFNIPPGEQIIV